MNIEEVLMLEKNIASIKKIDMFISSVSKNELSYFRAIAFKSEVFNQIGRVNEALKLLYSFVPYFSQMRNEEVLCICDAIINITKLNGVYDQMLKYIKLKQKYLSITNQSLYSKDLISYYLETKQFSDAKKEIEVLLANDLISKDRYIYLELLADLNYNDHDYQRFNELATSLLQYYNENILFEKANALLLKAIQIDFEIGRYIEALSKAKELLEESHLLPSQKIALATICIKCYLKNKEYRRATIVATEYEDVLELVSIDLQRAFILVVLQLYKEQNHLLSIKEYEEKLKQIDAQINDETVKQKKHKKIQIPKIEEEQNDVPEVGSISLVTKQETEINISIAYENLAKVFSYINTRDRNLKFREFFRLGAIEICKLFSIDEIIIVYYNSGYLGYHYKVERVYNKTFTNDDLVDTVFLSCIEQEKEVYLESNSMKNIIEQKNYLTKEYVLCFPLFEDSIVMGSIGFISKERFIDQGFSYEMLNLLAQMLNVRLNNELYLNSIEATNKKLFFISEAMSSGLKVESGNYVHSNTKTCHILGIYENLFVSDYESKIASYDFVAYKKNKELAINNLSMDISATYDFKKDDGVIRIKERFYPMLENGTVSLVSLIDDITEEEKVKKDLQTLVYENPISKLASEAKLFIDLNQVIPSKKFCIVLIDVNDFKLYTDIYGYAFTSQIIHRLGLCLKEITTNDFNCGVYHLEADKFVLLYKTTNDRRLVVSKTLGYLEKLQEKLNSINKRIKLSFSAGIYRYTANQNVTDSSKILGYAAQGLLDAKEIKDGKNHVCLFDQRTYQKRFAESQLITHISECIDHNKMSITYQQIIDLSEMNVYAYIARLNLVNYDVDLNLMNHVIERRGLEDLLDKYLIQHTLMELKNFYNQTQAFLKVCIPVHEATIRSESFLAFLIKQFDFFKIPKESVILFCNDYKESNAIYKELIGRGFFVASNQIERIFLDSITHFLLQYKKYKNSYNELVEACNKRKIVIMNSDVDLKEDIQIQRNLNTKYIFGKYYKKNIQMNELIQVVLGHK